MGPINNTQQLLFLRDTRYSRLGKKITMYLHGKIMRLTHDTSAHGESFKVQHTGSLHRGQEPCANILDMLIAKAIGFLFLFYRFFSHLVRVRGRNKNKNKTHSGHFPIELKSKETRIVFPSILIQLENGPNEFYFYFTI